MLFLAITPLLIACVSAWETELHSTSPLPRDECQVPLLPWTTTSPDLAVCPAVTEATAHSSNQTATDGKTFRSGLESWVQGNTCHRLPNGGDRFCAYTHLSFSGGEGISIITTPERIAQISSWPIFEDENDDNGVLNHASFSPSYEDAEIPGKGIGLIATRPIRAGLRVMARTPALMVDSRALEGLDQVYVAELMGGAVEQLPREHRGRFLNLSTHDDVRLKGFNERVHWIFSINRFRTGLGDGGAGFHSAFTEVSRLNHDCRPNCVYYFDPNTLTHHVVAVSDIFPGEELSVSYIDGFQPSTARKETLQNHWGFPCSCHRCTAEPHLVAESDNRIAQIRQLWKELDDYSSSSTATPEKAELLVLLYEMEGMLGRMQEAYYRAAMEWNGVGHAAKAMAYARLCIDRGLAFKGPGKPFIESMEMLLREPEAHHSWRFRVGQMGSS
ncbi:uncharacterized protein BCR38DRAFT_487889 [Pseudomassariella vexata]|uniref:SET domain-containing protein n=1 Tax=Pseudomassariella vexata TaxID=1141098 RepID=A0A1Y2DNF9_9PEZI|nr:uncharacterized protein BCR38DRAFT_487889 [Pseudomassariella vexata]ORY60828.1 hypothetical protein BCR38DRAFT_487889 [Pseudomassariella vexata]